MSARTDICAPVEQEGTRAVVRKWLKNIGDRVRLDEPVVELETDKVAVEVAAEADGVLAEILLQSGADAAPGAVLGRLSAEAGEGRKADSPGATPLRPTPLAGASAPSAEFDWPERPQRSIATFDPELRLSPSVRRRLIEAELDPTALTGSGRGGRLTRDDVEAALIARGGLRSSRPAAPAEASPKRAVHDVSVPHDSMRRRIAEHMLNSVTTAPHVTAMFEADFSRIIAHRQAHREAFARQQANLTLSAYFVAAAAQAMAAAPAVNSRWFEDRLEIYGDVNIGMGVALGAQGLIVPVIHRAQALSLLEIAQRLGDVTDRARRGKLTPADVKGGTFSISNHGVSGSLVAAPIIINQPQSAILGVGKLEKRVIVREVDGADTLQIRPMAYVTLTIDHRAIDGHQTNAWLSRFVEVLESWQV